MAKLASTSNKEIKELIKNYKPVSLLPIRGKIFERVYPYIIDNNLISLNQSGVKQGSWFIYQLLLIKHEIHIFFDHGFEVCGVFLDN